MLTASRESRLFWAVVLRISCTRGAAVDAVPARKGTPAYRTVVLYYLSYLANGYPIGVVQNALIIIFVSFSLSRDNKIYSPVVACIQLRPRTFCLLFMFRLSKSPWYVLCSCVKQIRFRWRRDDVLEYFFPQTQWPGLKRLGQSRLASIPYRTSLLTLKATTAWSGFPTRLGGRG